MPIIPFRLLSTTTLLLSLLLAGCRDQCHTTSTYLTRVPVYQLKADLRNAIGSRPAQAMQSPGKIYARGSYVFVNELDKGIHVVNNADPRNPRVVSFLNIPGNRDLAVRGDILYADNYTDLVALDISNPEAVRVVNRVEDAFGSYYASRGAEAILTSYREEWVTTEHKGDCDKVQPQANRGWGQPGFNTFDRASLAMASQSGAPAAAGGAGGGNGVGGSMARFTLYDRFLYVVTHADMHLFDISIPANPTKGEKISLRRGDIETIFPYGDKLFIGSQTGMHIYDNQTPAKPEWLATYEHVRSCDPVVVEGNYAYVTLRSGNACQGFTNQLDVLDISNLRRPTLLKTYPMQNPHGLGIDNNALFLCEGSGGLKVFDATNKTAIDQNLLAHFQGKDAYDVIPLGNAGTAKILLMVGKDGLYQYDYANPRVLQLLSVLPVKRL